MCNNSKTDREKILNNHLETIWGFSNREYQERVWIRGEGPEIDDYTESICHFFDDGDPIISNYEDYSINNRQLILLIKLREAIQDFNTRIRFDLGPDFLYSSEWAKITLIAKEVLDAFNYHQRKGGENKFE